MAWVGFISLVMVIPAKAGIHGSATEAVAKWIPPFAGMTKYTAVFIGRAE
jgi:hypothetical protein